MLTWLFYLIALIVIVAVLTVAFGKVLGRGEVMPELAEHESIVALNEEAVRTHNFSRVTFDTVLRGYRQDQVDAVIIQLIAENEELRQRAGVAVGEAVRVDKQQP
ncbi:DivIVA domain-containing protein [Staphylococcus chromogenes]|nr:DivIVA domain-containing protein [Staphylococcus chromogenes]